MWWVEGPFTIIYCIIVNVRNWENLVEPVENANIISKKYLETQFMSDTVADKKYECLSILVIISIV